MSYTITAEASMHDQDNLDGDKMKVDVMNFRERDGIIIFSASGDFDRKEELTKALCHSLIDAGFLAFSIRHSY